MADPWLCLAAAATATSHVLLGPMVTPLVRRRPQIVAREIVTLDHLSGGRAVLGVGLGADIDFTAYGEPLVNRGARLDEALTVLTGLLTGDEVDFDGAHYRVHSPPSLPAPVQRAHPDLGRRLLAQPGAVRARRPLRRRCAEQARTAVTRRPRRHPPSRRPNRRLRLRGERQHNHAVRHRRAQAVGRRRSDVVARVSVPVRRSRSTRSRDRLRAGPPRL